MPTYKHRKPKLSGPRSDGQYYANLKSFGFKTRYYGKDEQVARERFEFELPFILKGEHPPMFVPAEGGNSVRAVLDLYVRSREPDVISGQIGARTFADYKDIAKWAAAELGPLRSVDSLTSADWFLLFQKMKAKWSGDGLWPRVSKLKTMFNKAYRPLRLIESPPDFEGVFVRPNKAAKRRQRRKQGPRLFKGDKLVPMLEKADEPLKTMILLGLNCALHSSEVANLKWSELDLDISVYSSFRSKTGIPRMAWLWPESVEHLRNWRPQRPSPESDSLRDYVFLTSRGNLWVRNEAVPQKDGSIKTIIDTALAKKFMRFKKEHGFEGSFSWCRTTFKTYSLGAQDSDASRLVMGHSGDEMDERYDEFSIEPPVDEWLPRLRAVCGHVRRRLLREANLDPESDVARLVRLTEEPSLRAS